MITIDYIEIDQLCRLETDDVTNDWKGLGLITIRFQISQKSSKTLLNYPGIVSSLT
jgi:hypothetical protein